MKMESFVKGKSILLLMGAGLALCRPARSGAASAAELSTANEIAQMAGLREVAVDEFLLER